MATIQEQLSQLTDEELLALEQEVIKNSTPEGIQVSIERHRAEGLPEPGGQGRGLLQEGQGQLMVDAQDNKAMVFPDGTFQEV